MARDGNCTIKMSSDGKTFQTITPLGMKSSVFPCGRNVGYESTVIKTPKSMVSAEGGFVILQFEMQTYMGTIVQCSDLIIQKTIGFSNQKCDPHCKNGGVC